MLQLAADIGTRIITPVHQSLPFGDGVVAYYLSLGTIAQETRFGELSQEHNGPAHGLWSMEPFTHDDCWTNWLAFKPTIAAIGRSWMIPSVSGITQLDGNLFYAAFMARIKYRRAPAPLPATPDPASLGAYWKEWYNSSGGAGTVDEFIANFNELIGTSSIA